MLDLPPIRLLIVDDQAEVRELCVSIGGSLGLQCVEAESAEEALQRAESEAPEMVLSDVLMGRMSGLELLAEIKRRWSLTEVALMSAYGSIESAVEAMRLGAYDFVVKPFPVEKVRLVLQGMAEKVRVARSERPQNDGQLSGTDLATLLPEPCMDLEELERFTVQRVFEMVDGDKLRAQKLLGISRATLYRKMKRYGIKSRRMGQNVQVKVVRDGQERVILLSQS
jgi:DNA-binding NtrC family response regulator